MVLLAGLIALCPSFSFAEIESADMVPTALSESDQAALAKEKAKLDGLRTALLDDIAQQNTECGQVAESNTFQVDLCRNRQSFLMDQIGNYKTRLKEYRDKIQKALFMAPQGKVAVQSGLVFKDIPAPAPAPKRDAELEVPPADLRSQEPPAVAPLAYFNDPQNDPRVRRAKEEADQSHTLHAATSKAMLDEVSRAMADVRARTVAKNPRLGREEVEKIVSQDPDVRRKAAAWLLIHTQTKKQAQDLEDEYEKISQKAAKELDGKRGRP